MQRGFAEAQSLFIHAPARQAPQGSGTLGAHDAVVAGLPAAALQQAVESIGLLRDQAVFEAIMAISLRTYHRLKDQPGKRLDAATGGRLWRFLDILARTAELVGGQAEAERWLATPQMGLEQRRPIDLLATPAGTALVETLLDRMDYDVYP